MGKLEKRPVHVRKHKRKKPSGGYTTVSAHIRRQKVRVNPSAGENAGREYHDPRPPRPEAVPVIEDGILEKVEDETVKKELKLMIQAADGDYVGIVTELLSSCEGFECKHSKNLARKIAKSVGDSSEKNHVYERALEILLEHTSEKVEVKGLARVIAFALTVT